MGERPDPDITDEKRSGARGDAVVAVRSFKHLLVLSCVSASVFAGGLLVTESVGEFAMDVDFKPFFLPFLLITLVRFGIPTLSIGFGAAIGEGALDVIEGYELDDPGGFLGYVIGCFVFGWYLEEIASEPTTRRSQTVAAIFGAFVQALIEALAFLLVQPGTAPGDVVLEMLGNTATHGIILGAVPLVILYPAVRDYINGRQT